MQRSRLWHQKARAQVLTPIPEPLHSFSFPRISGLPCKGGRIPSSQRPSPFCLPSAPNCCRQQPTQSPPIGRTLAAVPRVPTTLNCTLSREESRPLGAGLSFPFVSPLSGSHLSAVPLTQLLAALRRTPRTEVVAADPAPLTPPRAAPGGTLASHARPWSDISVFFSAQPMVGMDTKGSDPCSGHRRQAIVLQTGCGGTCL